MRISFIRRSRSEENKEQKKDLTRNIPDELLLKVFSFCKNESDFCNISQVSRRWNRISKDGTLWQRIITPVFGFIEDLKLVDRCRTAYIATKMVMKELNSEQSNPHKIFNSYVNFSNVTLQFDKAKAGSITDQALKLMCDQTADLQHFKLISGKEEDFEDVSAEGLNTVIKKFPKLETFHLDGCHYISGLDMASSLEKLTGLKTLYLKSNNGLRDSTVIKIINNNPDLENITLAGLPYLSSFGRALSDTGIQALKKCKKLKNITIHLFKTPVSETVINSFPEELDKLERLDVKVEGFRAVWLSNTLTERTE